MGLGLRSSTLISSTKVRWSVIVSKSGSKFNTFECFECHHANGHRSLQVMMMLIVSSSSRRNKPTGFREAYRVRSTRTCDTKQHSKNCHSGMSVRCLSGLLSQELQNTFLTPTKSAPMKTHRDSRQLIFVSQNVIFVSSIEVSAFLKHDKTLSSIVHSLDSGTPGPNLHTDHDGKVA